MNISVKIESVYKAQLNNIRHIFPYPAFWILSKRKQFHGNQITQSGNSYCHALLITTPVS